ncbi:uncharacterized protein LOC119579919 [Penaeus monodon]|uniref:uncharacterized protein LOC119579919 n=1 Tax=Penaeus monodon TaxID=6687 RepID=UPI0018A76DA2|nr:uncharacterized protein LOC119579919 [Penaeus monodon]
MGGVPPLTGKWHGPARVLKRLGPVSFEIQDVATEVQMKAHLNHLKRYCPPNELSYAAEDDEDDDDGDVGADEPPNSVDPWVAVLTSMVREPESCELHESLKMMLRQIYPEA